MAPMMTQTPVVVVGVVWFFPPRKKERGDRKGEFFSAGPRGTSGTVRSTPALSGPPSSGARPRSSASSSPSSPPSATKTSTPGGGGNKKTSPPLTSDDVDLVGRRAGARPRRHAGRVRPGGKLDDALGEVRPGDGRRRHQVRDGDRRVHRVVDPVEGRAARGNAAGRARAERALVVPVVDLLVQRLVGEGRPQRRRVDDGGQRRARLVEGALQGVDPPQRLVGDDCGALRRIVDESRDGGGLVGQQARRERRDVAKREDVGGGQGRRGDGPLGRRGVLPAPLGLEVA